MKTLLVGMNAKYIHTNLAIRYLYAYTYSNFDVDFYEYTIKDQIPRIVEEIIDYAPDLVGFSCYIWNIEPILAIVSKLKTRRPNLKVLLGGPEVSYDAPYFLNHYPIDFIISGEGEYPFYQLLKALSQGTGLDQVPQLYYKIKSRIVHNNQEYIIDVNQLPSPYRLKRDLPHLENRIQYIESSRGCPYRCSYCLASLEKHVRQFDAEKIKEEIRFLMEHGAKVFKFLDRTFNIRKDYALDMFRFIIREHRPGTVFQFEISGDLLDESIIDFLNENAPKGLIRFEIGIQSTNPLTNRLVLRIQNNEKLFKNIRRIQAGGKIVLHLDLIAGLPKEDYLSFQKTFNDVFALRPQELQLGFLKMLRGTKLRLEADRFGYRFDNRPPYEVIENDSISEEQLNRIRQAEFILNKYYNSHRFTHTLNYLLNHLYRENPYQFFETFGMFWFERYEPIGYQHHDLYMRLDCFIYQEHPQDYETIHSLLVFDYLKDQKRRPRFWFKSEVSSTLRNKLYRYLHEWKPDLTLDLLYRYGRVFQLSIHPMTHWKETTYFIKLFHPNNQDYYLVTQKEIDRD